MSYTVVDHGVWRPYSPDPMPEWAIEASRIGGAIVFFRREWDGLDFYEWLKTNPFQADSIVAHTLVEGGNPEEETVKAVFRDSSMLSPHNQRVIEIQGVDPNEKKPHNLFAWLTYHPDTHTFSGEPTPPTPPPAPVLTFKKDIWLRSTDEEADIIKEVLGKQTLRKQRIFNEAQFLNHSDELFSELYDGFVKAFGKDRADGLLAASN